MYLIKNGNYFLKTKTSDVVLGELVSDVNEARFFTDRDISNFETTRTLVKNGYRIYKVNLEEFSDEEYRMYQNEF